MSVAESDAGPPVLVVGAGPVGMTAALALDARGVPVEVLEADPADRDRPGSRAIFVHGATLRRLETIRPGLGETLVEDGLIWPTRRTLFRGKQVFERTYDDPGGTGDIPHFTSLPQVWTEGHLLDALEAAGVPVHWDCAVETVETSDDGVVLETQDGDVRATDYAIGADGAGSTVRSEIGAEFEGDRSKNHFVIADVEEHPDEPRPLERVFHYDHPDLDGRNVLMVPFSGGWRVDIQCLAGDDPDAMGSDERMAEMTATVLGERYRDRVDWVSTYQFLQVTADRLTDEHRRVLLAGEAGHLFAPFGARGMNSGIVDADAAASAIAVARRATEDAVARAEVETVARRREQAAEWNRDAAGQALAHLQGDGLATRAKKRGAALVSGLWEDAGEWLDDAPYGPHGGPPVSVGQY